MSRPTSIGAVVSRGRRTFSGGGSEIVPQSRLSGPMPWVIAIMVALTVIALAAGLALGNAVSSARAELEGGLTVQLVEAREEERDAQAEAALAALQDMPGVVSLRRVPREEVDALIEPWLGEDIGGTAGDSVPVPALIDVRLDGTATQQRLREVEQRLRPVAPSARIDAQANWLRPVFAAITSLQWLAIALVALLFVALAAAVLLAARTALGTNRETIEIVHLLGGTDGQIARVFQRSIGVDALGGGVVGLVLAAAVILALGRRFSGLGAGMVDNGALGLVDWLLLALVPVVTTLLAMVTARITVIRTLRKML
ncbi:cell division protein FtsX [Novosphingobium aquimarinum]|uniref:cell division protein FtsX n=1 Tax=Novosphingobium aquimarinum TaxID=2682494 RepID=UPI0038CD6970